MNLSLSDIVIAMHSLNRCAARGWLGVVFAWAMAQGWFVLFSADCGCAARGVRVCVCVHAEWVRLGKISSKAFLTRASLSACMDDYMTAPQKNEWIKMPAKHPAPSSMRRLFVRFSNAYAWENQFWDPATSILNGWADMPTAKFSFRYFVLGARLIKNFSSPGAISWVHTRRKEFLTLANLIAWFFSLPFKVLR